MDTRDPGMNSEALLIQTGDLEAWFYPEPWPASTTIQSIPVSRTS